MAHILYCSLATWTPKPSQWNDLVRRAKGRNLEAAISSLLVYGSGGYVHWLEGPRSTLTPLWQRIRADARHHQVTLLLREDRATHRLYPEWPLRVHGPLGLPEITHVVRDLVVHSQEGADGRDIAARVVRQMLDVFGTVPDPDETAD